MITTNIKIKSAKLIGWQKDFVKKFQELKPDDILVVKKQRQVGASFTASQILFYVAFNRPNSTSIFVTTTQSAARKFFQDMAQFCKKASSIIKLNESLLEMNFYNGSKIYFRSSESQLRSLSCREGGILVCDEVAFLQKEVWTQILPFVTVSHANIIIISTPWAKRGMYYTFYQRAANKERGFYLIDTKNYDLSWFISEQQKENYKKILSPQAYRTEIEGEFIDTDTGIFRDFTSLFKKPDNDGVVYAGLDFAVSVGGDDLSLTGFNELKQQTLLYTDNETPDPIDRIKKVAQIINSHPECKKLVCETNSMGSSLIAVLKRELNNPSIIINFTTSNASKKEIINELIEVIGKKDITLLDNEKQSYQLEIFQFVELKNGNYTYKADTKVDNSHDDTVMSLAFAVRAFNSNRGQYIVR